MIRFTARYWRGDVGILQSWLRSCGCVTVRRCRGVWWERVIIQPVSAIYEFLNTEPSLLSLSQRPQYYRHFVTFWVLQATHWADTLLNCARQVHCCTLCVMRCRNCLWVSSMKNWKWERKSTWYCFILESVANRHAAGLTKRPLLLRWRNDSLGASFGSKSDSRLLNERRDWLMAMVAPLSALRMQRSIR